MKVQGNSTSIGSGREPDDAVFPGLLMGGDEDVLLYGTGHIMRAVVSAASRKALPGSRRPPGGSGADR